MSRIVFNKKKMKISYLILLDSAEEACDFVERDPQLLSSIHAVKGHLCRWSKA